MPNFSSTEEAFSMARPRLKRGEGTGLKQGRSAAQLPKQKDKAAKPEPGKKQAPKKGAKKK